MKTLFVGPSDTGEFIWGAGPLFVLPTAMDDRMRTDKWGIGPAAVGLTIKPPWVFGPW